MINKYKLELLYCEKSTEILIDTNYIIEASSHEEALSIANNKEYKVSKNISLYYDNTKDEIFIDILDNPYVSKCEIKHYKHIKDTAIGRSETFNTPNGKLTLAPIFDDDDFIKCSKNDFITYLKNDFKNYLTRNTKLMFSCISYGIKKL